MYQSTFGITAPPFQLTADPSFYFDSTNHHRALTTLRRWLAEVQGLVVVTGEVGVGKTTLVRTLLSEVDPAVLTVANVVSTQLDADDLLSAASIGFGIAGPGFDSAGRLAQPADDAENLRRFLLGLANKGRRAMLIIDEAQNLPRAALDRLLAFGPRMVPRGAGLLVWLVGQPELRAMLEAPDAADLRSLVRGACHLGPLGRDETGPYIEHRLAKVGWNGTPRFEPGAFDAIFQCTQGVPRRMNQLCNRLLMARSFNAEMRIDAASVELLASELRAEIGLDSYLPASASRTVAPFQVDARTPASASPDRHHVLGPAAGKVAPLLCVASDLADYIKAAAFIRAFAIRAEAGHAGTPPTTLLRVQDSDSLAYCGRLFAGLDATGQRVDLNVPDGPHEAIVVELMAAFASAVEKVRPGAVVVFDGSPTAFSCSTVARARQIPIVHIGAGLRADDSFVTAAATRKLTDHLADLLFTTDAQASETLGMEGVSPERVHCVGNLLVDALSFAIRLRAPPKPPFENPHGYALVVLSNPVNIESRDPLAQLTEIVSEVSRVIPIVWLLRSRLHAQLKKYHLGIYLPKDRVRRLPAQPYIDYVALLRGATCVLTDSWKVQEEASALQIPCLVVGVFPERRIAGGSNLSVGLSRTRAVSAVWECVLSGAGPGRIPPLWDGRAGARIAGYLSAWNPPRVAVL